MNTNRIQAAFARKREQEYIKNQTTAANHDYFDYWNKVNSRYETWTAAEYYNNSNQKIRLARDKQTKEAKLIEKRKTLQLLLDKEKQLYDTELSKIIQGNKSNNKLKNKCHLNDIPTNLLQKIDENLKIQDDERRRIELEAKLYASWRQPTSSQCLSARSLSGNHINNSQSTTYNQNLLYESKSDHQAMAKLCWLDKQIENQMKREKDTKESEIRNLKIQEERRKHEETLKERQCIRESELKELRSILEHHVAELKKRENEIILLTENQNIITKQLKYLKNETENLQNRQIFIQDYKNQSQNNVSKVKMIFRERSKKFYQYLRDDVDVLISINKIYDEYDTEILQLINKYKYQINDEHNNQLLIKNMFESEAKENLQKWENLWYEELQQRQTQILQFIAMFIEKLEHKYENNMINLNQFKFICKSHVTSIQNTNQKLNVLINESKNEINNIEQENILTENSINNLDCKRNLQQEYKDSINDRFGFNWKNDEINNCGSNNCTSSRKCCKCRKFNVHSNPTTTINIENNHNPVPAGLNTLLGTNTGGGGDAADAIPKYGRKKIAWN